MKSKVKFSSEVMFPLIKEYYSSSISRTQFCREKEIKPHVLQYWLKRYKLTEEKPGSSSFSPIQIKDTHKILTSETEQDTTYRHIVIKTSTGLEIRIPV